MKILILTRLYPVSTEHYAMEKVPDVLHTFAKEWSKTEDVMVIRPLVTNINPFKVYKYDRKKIFPGYVILEGINLLKIRIIRLPFFELYFRTGRIIDFLQKENFHPDVIVSHLSEGIFIADKIAGKMGVPLICGIHKSDLEFMEYPLAGMRFKKILAGSSGIACRSLPIYSRLIRVLPRCADKTFIANSGIDEKMIMDYPSSLRKIRNWKKTGKIKFVTVGQLIRRKKIHNVIEVLARLKDRIDFEYTIVGDGEEKHNLEMLAETLGIGQKVIFSGYKPRRDVIETLKKTDIFIMVSDQETFGIVYLEAMACGNIVIGAKDWGIDGIIQNGRDGFLCAVDDNSELEDLITRIRGMKMSVLSTLMQNSFKTINEFTEKRISKKYLDDIRSFSSAGREKTVILFPKDSIGFFDHSSRTTFGGATVQLHAIAEELTKQNIDVISLIPDYHAFKNSISLPYAAMEAYRTGDFIVTKIFTILSLIKKIHPRYFFQRGISPFSVPFILLLKMIGIKTVFMFAHDIETRGFYQNSRKKFRNFGLLLKFSALLVCQNDSQKTSIPKKYHPKTLLFKKGIELSEFTINPQKKFMYDGLWIARCEEWKKPELFIELARNNPGRKMVMVCSPSNDRRYYDSIKKMAGDVPNISFFEKLSNTGVREIIQKCRVFVLTSDSEGDWPMTVLESAASGTPLLSLNINIENSINEFEFGYFCSGSVRVLDEKFRMLCGDRAMLLRMGKNARRFIETVHSVENNISRLIMELERFDRSR